MGPTIKIRALPTGVAGAAAAALGGALAWYQLFKRPLPRARGRLRVGGIDAPVNILRDRHGVPHIRTRGVQDLFFGVGFVHGQDRLWQLEFFRRATAGRISEFSGPDGLAVDRLMRTLGMRRAAEREDREMSGKLRDLCEAYCSGINAAIDSSSALPLEFQILRIEPEPWRTVDLLAASKLMAFGLSTNWEMELHRAQLVRDAGAERAAQLEPQYPRGTPIITTPGSPYTGQGSNLAHQIEKVKEELGLTMHATGSNNWVVSGERSVTGRPLLACDPHLTLTIPDLWYHVDLACNDFRARGATLPTNPFPAYAQTEHCAWGYTNVMGDVQDLFVERFNEDDPRLYEFDGGWREAEIVREEIRVKGRSKPEVLDVTITHHGPIVNDSLGAHDEQPLALSWTGLQHPLLTDAGHEVFYARNGDELLEAGAHHTAPALNMLWADRDGNIGYKLLGKLPIREGGSPDLPKPGWTGDYEWVGTIPYDELPSHVNPPQGFLVTANNRIVDDDYPHHITSEWMTGYRAQRIEDMLGERERHSLDDFERMQIDFYSYPGIETVHRLSRLQATTQREIRAIERLKSWDGVLDVDSIAGSIYSAFTVVFAEAVAEAAIRDERLRGQYMNRSEVELFEVISSPWRFSTRLLEMWDEGDPAWFATDQHPQGREWNDVALECLSRALDLLSGRYGPNSDKWRWGQIHKVEFTHPFGSANAILRRIFNRTVEAGGASETVTQIGYLPTEPFKGTWGPVYRMLADIDDPQRSRWQITTGQSGQPGSRHYDDKIGAWLDGRTNPVYADEQELRAAGSARHLRLDPG
ncbi:MAG: penicillin acylase family protein [Solirubrobacterales bacterium]